MAIVNGYCQTQNSSDPVVATEANPTGALYLNNRQASCLLTHATEPEDAGASMAEMYEDTSDQLEAIEADTAHTPHSDKALPLCPHCCKQQNLKTQELQMAEMYEDTSDQLEAMEVDLAAFKKEAKRDVEVARNDLLGALKSGFEAVDEKVEAAAKERDERLEQYQKVCGGGVGRSTEAVRVRGGLLNEYGAKEQFCTALSCVPYTLPCHAGSHEQPSGAA